MSMPLSTWAIRNPIPPIVLFLILTVAGLIAFKILPINNMPNISVPIVEVEVVQPGAAATEIEAQVTRRVESAVAGLQGVKHIVSIISEGNSRSTIEFQLETDIDRAVNDTRDAIAQIREDLPRSIQDPVVKRIDIEGGAILIYSVEAPEMLQEDVAWFVDDRLSRELLAIRGVAGIQRQGGVEHEITLTLERDRLAAFGISAADISRQLAQTNIDLPGGRITLSGTEYALRTLGSAQSVEILKETRIALGNGREVKLSDLGTLSEGAAEERSITRLNGKPVVTFEVYRSKEASEVSVARAVDAKLAIIAAQEGIQFKEIFSLVTLTINSFHSTVYTFLEGAFLTVCVVFFFLRDKRATIIAALAIPLSIIPTFLCLYWLGFTLNTISLLAISLVTGVLVDDAIVEIENIHRHMRMGKSVFDAAMVAADEIGLAVVATTLVICAVFVPVSFMGGIPGQFFKQFGLTVAIAAFFSLLVARLLTPMLAAYLLKPVVHYEEEKPKRWQLYYQRLVAWTLNHRFNTLMIAAFSMLLSFGMIPFLSSGFLPYEDYSQSRLTLELPQGATLAQTDAAAQQVVDILREYKEVEYVLTSVGSGAQGASRPMIAGAGGVNKANIEVKLVPPNKRTLSQREFENAVLPVLQQLPDMRINFANAAGAKDISIALVGDDSKALERTAEVLEREMRGIKEISSVSSSASLKQPEIIITPDFAKAAELGISVQTMSEAINIATIGDIEANLAKFNYGNRQIPIRVRLPEGEGQLATIENLKLSTLDGASVPLSAIAQFTFSMGPTTIERYDRERKIALEANLNGAALGDALDKIYALPVMQDLPEGIGIRKMGDAEIMTEVFNGFFLAMATGLLMVYAIQVLLYKDWIQPITRMVALPLSIGGAFLMLLLTGTDFGMPAVIGILMLMGIADKNSILLVDYMLEKIKSGMPREAAIKEACFVRARPIIMTSLSMFAGMLPIALGFGLDSAFRAPMAIAVIGGLISSTALSLIFVPVMFSYVRDFEEWLIPKLKRLM